MVVAGGAGSGTDLIARALADAANRGGMKPPIRVRNIDGEEGVKGARMVQQAKGDGCTMLIANQSVLANFLSWRAPFAWHDFRHVALLTRTPMVIAAPFDAGFDDGRGLVETARVEPVVFGVGPGTIGEFDMRALGKSADVEFQFDVILGARDRVAALLAGEIDATVIPTALAKRLKDTFRMKPIAVTDWAPSRELPDVSPLRDQGVAFDTSIDTGVMLPPSASADLAQKLADTLETAVADQAFQTAMAEYDVRIDFRPLTQYTIYWENLMASWREIAVEAGYERSSR
jgi:tripartite-type tricarboxylate transporter receptor subunit TctC